MKKLFASIVPEFIVILVLLITVRLFFNSQDITIKGDGQGYYDYLPSIFIYNDFPSKGLNDSMDISMRINNLPMYIDYESYKINKYPCGTALLVSPFFIGAHMMAPKFDMPQDGYSSPYQKAIYYAALFYLMLGLYFLKKLLKHYKIDDWIILFIQLSAVFATALTHYTYCDSSYSHVYSFFAITAFLYFSKNYFITKSNKSFLLAAFTLGLIVILRQMNGIIIFFLPFISGSAVNFRETLAQTFNKAWLFSLGVFISLAVFSIQSALWYIEAKQFFLYSYQGESFDFHDPAFFKVLFSYKKGLFVYAPILFFSFVGLIMLFRKKQYFQLIFWMSFFILLTYMISSWGYWSYGSGFGHRVYIDYYTVFYILLAIAINNLKRIWKYSFILLCISTIALNIIQTKQYNLFILHWDKMNKLSYWKVFLKLDHRYQGFLWKKTYYFNDKTTKNIDSLLIGDLQIQPKSWVPILIEDVNNFSSFNSTNIIQIKFKNDFLSKNKSKIVVSITDSVTNNIAYYHEAPIIHFPDNNILNEYQEGVFNFEFTPIKNPEKYVLKIHVKTEDKELIIDNLKIKMLGYLL